MIRLPWILVVFAFFACTEKKDGISFISGSNNSEAAVIEEKLKVYYSDMSNRDRKKYKKHFWYGATLVWY